MEFERNIQKITRHVPIRIAWISDFPIEWMPDLPLPLQSLPKQHPSTWQVVLLSELEKNPALQIYVIVLRKQVKQNFTFEKNGVVFHILKVPGGLRAPSFFWLDTFLINRVLKKIQPDLVHAWGVEKGAATVASRLDYPHLITLQGLFTWLKELVPVGNYQRFIALCETISFKRIKMATTESAFAVQYLKTKYPKLQVFQAEHAPNWIFHRIQRRPQIQPVRFVCVATLGYAKGTDLLLRALDELAREFCFELVLIGAPNPTFLNSLKSTVSPEFWRRIVLKTDLSPPEVAEELATATMLLLPTRADTSPNAVKEAVVAGVPVVASAIGGIVDYVFPGKNGFLFPSNNLDEFIKSIRAACQHPLFSRGEVDAEALKKSREYLSPQTMGRRFLEAYEKALKLGNV